MFVCHNCPGGDNPACVNPAHLFLGTRNDNIRDAQVKGMLAWTGTHPYRRDPDRVPRGERRGNAKLNESAVREIRRLAASGVAQNALAASYGISKAAMHGIVHGKSWQHVH
jgi:hypothetical protein